MMELEELKKMWTSLDERLNKQEVLKESIIREMIYAKSNKSLSRLLNMEALGAVVFISIIAFIAFVFEKFGGKRFMWDITVIYSGIFCLVFLPWILYKIHGLMKIDLSGSIKNNVFYINRFNIQIKREKISTIFWGPVFAVLIILVYLEAKASVSVWIVMSCGILLASLSSYWSYKKIYDKNIALIKKSLEELKELEEE
jgi:hypothetical protein